MNRLYPCICGFKPLKRAHQVQHRSECTPWKNRSHPDLIRQYRKKRTLQLQAAGELRFNTCKECHRPINKHASGCQRSRFHQAAIEVLKKNGMDPVFFVKFLRVLARKYGATDVDESVFCLWEQLP